MPPPPPPAALPHPPCPNRTTTTTHRPRTEAVREGLACGAIQPLRGGVVRSPLRPSLQRDEDFLTLVRRAHKAKTTLNLDATWGGHGVSSASGGAGSSSGSGSGGTAATPAQLAARHGHLDVFLLLCKAGADVVGRASDGTRAVDVAFLAGCRSVVLRGDARPLSPPPHPHFPQP
jgi:hypothetical protein